MLQEFLTKLAPSRESIRVFGMVSLLLMGTLAGGVTFPAPDGDSDGLDLVGTASAESYVYNETNAFLENTESITNFTVAGMTLDIRTWEPFAFWSTDPGDEVDTSLTDAQQLRTDMLQQAAQTETRTELAITGFENRVTNSENEALMFAKNEYIRSVNNGSDLSTVKSDVNASIDDYYSKIEYNMLQSWDAEMANLHYQYSIATNESNITPSDVIMANAHDHDSDPVTDHVDIDNGADITTSINYSVTLPNGSTYTPNVLHVEGHKEATDTDIYGPTEVTPWGSNNFETYWTSPSEGHGAHIVDDATSTDWGENTQYQVVHLGGYYNVLQDIDTKRDSAKAQMNTFIEGSYSSYSSGMIDDSDLIDPYLANTEYSPNGSFEVWAMTHLQQLGITTPENLSTMGEFVVEDHSDGQNHTGILLTDETPANQDYFAVNTTYDSANIGGPQMVVTNDSMVELESTFTIHEVTDSNGETVENVTYKNVTYTTADNTELQELYDELAYQRAQIEALEESLLAGGGFDFSDIGMAGLGAILIGVAVLMGRD